MKKMHVFAIIIVVLLAIGLSGCGAIREFIDKDPLGNILNPTSTDSLVEKTDQPSEPTPTSTAEPEEDLGPFILLQDNFSDPDSGWEIYLDDYGRADYEDGGYLVEAYQTNEYAWGVAGGSFTDVRIEVDAQVLQTNPTGNDGFGVDCRVQENGDGYGFRISSDGYASIAIFSDQQSSPLVDWIASDEVFTDGRVNHFTVVCQGNHLSLMVNDVNVIEAVDDTYTEGDIALSAISYESEPITVLFDDIIVQSLGNPYEYADQEEYSLFIDNPTSQDACTVLIDPSTEEYWGENHLESVEVIPAGGSMTFEGITGNPVDIRVENCQHLVLFEYYEVDLTGGLSIELIEPEPLFKEAFENLEGWPSGEVDGGEISLGRGGGYSLAVTGSDKLIFANSDFEGSDVIVHTLASMSQSGTDGLGYHGVTCRVQSDGSGVFFAFRGDGYANIILVEGEERIELLDWTHVNFEVSGAVENYIEGDCIGSWYTMYINGIYIGSVEDEQFSSGKTGVGVYSPGDEPTRAEFNFLDVYAGY